eukprot:CAMPEP_0115183154 /NCGR_PEP_ID=MMETSP0270-20121206/8310_1 /TAXON_ID=71861 /ORGANISM="Scrippsiella trochoidea, Strain CCMP3099" /LENGTH=105 /DNA_ID=CAMNT_0002596219 /DNA_START=26 /DNA_END=343 /DNA_ORIENTATION=+
MLKDWKNLTVKDDLITVSSSALDMRSAQACFRFFSTSSSCRARKRCRVFQIGWSRCTTSNLETSRSKVCNSRGSLEPLINALSINRRKEATEGLHVSATFEEMSR